MRLIVFLALIGFALYWYTNSGAQEAKADPTQCASLVVYAASWCPACDRNRADLKANNVIFTEYFVDKDSSRDRLFRKKAAAAAVRIAYPTLEIDGVLQPRGYYAQDLITHFNVCHK